MARMSGGRTTEPDRPVTGLRMRELTEATGLPKSTILHYVAQGLLPEPVRTSRNMAYYDPGCVGRVREIRALQDQYAFPLSKIKKLLSLKDQGRDVTQLIELNEVVFGRAEGPGIGETAFCEATGLTARQVSELRGAKLLMPLKKGRFDRNDIAMGQIYAKGLAMGISISDLAFYPALAKKLVDEEMRLRRRVTKDLAEKKDAEITKQLVAGARFMRTYIIDRVFQLRIASARDLKDEALTS